LLTRCSRARRASILAALVLLTMGCDGIPFDAPDLELIYMAEVGEYVTDIGVSVDGRVAVSSTSWVWHCADSQDRIRRRLPGQLRGFIRSMATVAKNWDPIPKRSVETPPGGAPYIKRQAGEPTR
jgi:hypothetical protein